MIYEQPTHLDLFSGIGGFSLAFESEGFRTIGFSEIHPYACRVLKQRWPQVPNYGDIRNVPALKCAVLTGGFPCQDISVGGPGDGLEGRRSCLWFPMLDCIERCRPMVCLIENSPMLRTRGYDTIKQGLEGINYACRPFVVSSKDLGADQDRKRVYVVAYSVSQREEGFKWDGGFNGEAGPRRQGLAAYLLNTHWRARPVFENWPSPILCRADDGIPNRLDRIGCLGNAIVPQVAQIFARAIRQTLQGVGTL